MSTHKADASDSADDSLDQKPPKKGRGGRVFGIVAGLVLLLAVGLYAVGYVIAGDKLPRNAQIAGVAVGGLDRQGAIKKLQTELKDEADRPIPVTIDDKDDTVTPSKAGLTIDYERSVAQSGAGKSLDPRHIWRVITGGADSDPVIAVDGRKLKNAAAALANKYQTNAKDATLKFDGAKIKKSEGVSTLVLDQKSAVKDLEDAYLQDVPVVDLEVTVTEPGVTTKEVDTVIKNFAEPAVSGPITVKVPSHGQFEITAKMIGNSVTFEPKDGTLAPKLDSKALDKAAEPAVAKVELKKPKDATVALVDGKPKVVPAVDGTGVSEQDLFKAVQPVLTKTGAARTATVKLTGKKAKFTNEEAEKLGIKEVVGKFSTKFPYDDADYHNINIGRAAELMNGSVLKPGETFSLNDTLGERTKSNGFTDGYVIAGGVLKKETGGGVSQSATTLYNAMFKAGLKDIEHQPHTLYFDRYPAGREATVYWGSIDLKFQNDTDHGVLVQAYISKASPGKKGTITVKMWSTKVWDEIKTPDATKSDFYSGTTRYSDRPNCEYQAPIEGFRADYYRAFIKDGKEVKREKYHWKYSAGDKIICGNDPDA